MKNLKNIFNIITFVLIAQFSIAQTWQWSNQAGGKNINYLSDSGNKIKVDKSGNCYIVGSYQSDTCYFTTDTLTRICSTQGCYQYFLAKYSSIGTELWVRGMDNTSQNNLFVSFANVAYDSVNDYIYMTGAFKGSGSIGGAYLSASFGVFNTFLAKFDPNGNCVWVKKGESLSGSSANSIATDLIGNIIISGQSISPITFDTITIPASVFLAKYDSSGKCLWAKKEFNQNGTSYGFDAFLSQLKIKDNDIFAFGNGTISSYIVDTITVHENNPGDQYLIARFDSTGTAKWIKPCASSAIQLGNGDIVVDSDENSYITGYFEHLGIFDNDTITNNNQRDLFLAKYNSSGHLVWVRQGNSSLAAGGTGLAMINNYFYLTGLFYGNATFGSNNLSSSTSGDMFIARYDTSGSCIGILQVAKAGGSSVASDITGTIYVTGSFSDTATFGSNSSLISRGGGNIFLAKSDVITGINNNTRFASNQLIIYANPTTGTCNVTIPDEFKNEKKLTLQIFNNAGKLMQNVPVEMSGENMRLNLEEEAKGIYNIVLSDGKKSYNGRIVFE